MFKIELPLPVMLLWSLMKDRVHYHCVIYAHHRRRESLLAYSLSSALKSVYGALVKCK